MLSNQTGNGLRLLMGICALAISIGINLSSARAQDDRFPAQSGGPFAAAAPEALPPIKISADHPGNSTKPYFVEFRARSALSYGHTFLVHGRTGQKIRAKDVVGLHPATESSVPWMIGHLIPVVSETGASDGDYEEAYVIARYRVGLTEAEYKKTLATMRAMQKNHPVWHAVLYNCNRFVGDIAESMGLKAPANSLLMPKDFINTLKAMNNGRAELSPSRHTATHTASRHTPTQSATAPKRQRTASAAPKRQPASARREAAVNFQVNEYQRPE
jgi:hypothetical protein